MSSEGFGELFIVSAPSGAGKTTLIKLMAGLEQPTSGEIWFNGENVTGHSPQRRNVSLVHQFFINYENMNVFENIASPLRVAGMSRAEIDAVPLMPVHYATVFTIQTTDASDIDQVVLMKPGSMKARRFRSYSKILTA